MVISADTQILELDSFETAFPVKPGSEGDARRRFMTLFVDAPRRAQAGATGYVCHARSATGEEFAIKRLAAQSGVSDDRLFSEKDQARITQGRISAFYEEYLSLVTVSRLRGFPKLYGYGMVGEDPVILMEWVKGISLDALMDEVRGQEREIPSGAVAAFGAAVLEVLDSLARLDNTLVHRDISPANIMIRTDGATVEGQLATGRFDVCLIDFGSAAQIEASKGSFTMTSRLWRHGTPEYAPPEMLTRDIPNIEVLRKSPSIDVFALCSVLYELYAGHTPWRVGEKPWTSPYRLKMDNPPEPLEARVVEDEPLVDAVMSGLAIEQDRRPGVRELLRTLRRFAVGRGLAIADEGESGQALASGEAPAGLRLEVASAAQGGARAAWQSGAGGSDQGFAKPVSRRGFVAGVIAAIAAAVVCAGVAARSCSSRPGADVRMAGGPLADVLYSGKSLYPARNDATNEWMLVGSSVSASLGTAGYEPGRYVDGLIRVYDATSGGFGFKTVVGADDAGAGSGALGCAWAFARTFAAAGDFSPASPDGGARRLAAVKDFESGLWGYIDDGGSYVLEPAYGDAGRFISGFAPVRDAGGSGLWGIIDANGAFAAQPAFSKLGVCSEGGFAAAKDPETGRWGFVGLDGAWMVSPQFLHVRRFADGLAGFFDDDSGLWGFLDSGGKVAIPPAFIDVRPFADGAAPARDASTRLWGLLDASGSWQVEPRWLSLGDKTGDLFPAHGSPANVYDIYGKDAAAWDEYVETGLDSRFYYGYVDEEGAWVFRPQYGDTLIRPSEQ